MTAKLIALASAVLAAVALAPTAEAGGGVRLSFGGPLGTFIATPAKGAVAKPRRAPRKEAARKRPPAAPVREAARKSETPAPRAARTETAKVETAAAKPAPATSATAEDTAPLTGSSALIRSSVSVDDTEEAPAAAEVKADATSDSVVTAEAAGTADGDAGCTRFIPAVGMTVAVGCGD